LAFEYGVEQKVFEIGGVRVGGIPGERPVVLIGSIFYHGHKIVKDERKGEFDKEAAEKLLKDQEELSDRTGNPCMVDVVASTGEAMKRYLEFVSNVTDVPILVGGAVASARIEGIKYAKEVGLMNRVVYNSIVPDAKQDELSAIEEAGVESAVLLTFSAKQFTTASRVEAAKELVKIAERLGVKKVMVDTCTLDIPSLGMSCKAIRVIKDELGVPVGCGAHNAVSMWRGLKPKFGKEAVKPALASSCVMAVAVGADFILYGPIKDAKFVFPAVAMVDAAYGYLATESGCKLDRSHPLFRIA